MRDLNADLALCEAATPGPWRVYGGKFGETNVYHPPYDSHHKVVRDVDYDHEADAHFIAEAREGWPEAIRRAIAAEGEVATLQRDVTMETYGPICENCGGHRSVPPIDEWGEGPDCPVCYGVGTLTRDVLYRKIDELQRVVMDVYQKARNDVARWDEGQCVGLPVFQDRVYARRLVKDLQPILFPYQNK
ncbi:hypothetical protein [Paenibacillus polymyxa]|uniref:hypothetical protein n=1 Tax=Paenibacillus polymyxa TaxID=1406 RepID=UPI00296FA650|nr:hypothetical protein [Paenibacillus polymyxa]WOZ39805.1 hypothetical protein RQP19_07110 [Paenibacillus polymyxa]